MLEESGRCLSGQLSKFVHNLVGKVIDQI